MQRVQIAKDPLTASVVMVGTSVADVIIRQGKPVRLSHADCLTAAIGCYLLGHGFTGDETAHVRTLNNREWPQQSNTYTNAARPMSQAARARLLKKATVT